MELTKTLTATGKNGTFEGVITLTLIDKIGRNIKGKVAFDYETTIKIIGSSIEFANPSFTGERYLERQLLNCEKELQKALDYLANRENTLEPIISRLKELGYK